MQNVISCNRLASGGTCSLAATRQDKGMSSAAHALFMARSTAEHIDRRQLPSIAFSRDEAGDLPASSVTRDYSGLMFANLITLAHLSVSAAMSLPKSEGELENTEEP